MSPVERNLRHRLNNLHQLELSARYLLSSAKLSPAEKREIAALLPKYEAEAHQIESMLKGNIQPGRLN